jgi:hypothetical protein
MEEPVLMMPDHLKPFQIQVNSLLFATRGILTQMDTNGDRHPSCLPLQKFDEGPKELWHWRQRAIGNCMSIKGVETPYSRIQTYNYHPI